MGPAEDRYQLTISGFDSVGLTDPFYHSYSGWSLNGTRFTSRDRDHDNKDRDYYNRSNNCVVGKGGWWYNNCGNVLLNDDHGRHGAKYI